MAAPPEANDSVTNERWQAPTTAAAAARRATASPGASTPCSQPRAVKNAEDDASPGTRQLSEASSLREESDAMLDQLNDLSQVHTPMTVETTLAEARDAASPASP